jgi:hypothetical protein
MSKDDEKREPIEEEPNEEIAPSGEVWLAIADLLNSKEIRTSIKTFIEAHSNNVPRNHSFRIQSLWATYLFALIIFAGIVCLRIFNFINTEIMVSLLGPLFGFWFGRRSKSEN